MIAAAPLDIEIEKGADFSLPFQLFDDDDIPVSMAGAAITAKLRSAIGDAAAVATFTGTVTDGPNGIGEISMTAVVTAAIATKYDTIPRERKLTKYLWDANITFADGSVIRIFEGFAFVSPEVNY